MTDKHAGGLIQRIKLARDHRALLRTMRAYAPDTYSVSEYQDRELERRIKLFDSAIARSLNGFILDHIAVHDSVARDMRNLLENNVTIPSLSFLIKHFDYAVELGWRYAPTTLRFLKDASSKRNYVNFDIQHERAIILVEDSLWDKTYTTGSGMMKRAHSDYHPCVVEAAVERPQDVQRIIDVAKKHNIQTVQQLFSLVDGTSIPTLSEGAL